MVGPSRLKSRAVDTILGLNAGRDPDRLALKFAHLRKSPFVFLRGTCHLFYDRLASTRPPPKSPLVWACGDLHLENFGSFKGDNRLVYFDVNDFDESALAPASWDLVRFLASVLLAADELKADGKEARKLCDGFVRAYAAALAAGSARWIERDTARGLVGELLESLASRTRIEHLKGRTDRKRRRRTLHYDDKHAIPVSAAEKKRVTKMIDAYAGARPDPGFFEVLDVAHRIAGTGSLGLERYVVLVEGKGSPDGNYLLDLKQSRPSSLAPHLKNAQPAWRLFADTVLAFFKGQ